MTVTDEQTDRAIWSVTIRCIYVHIAMWPDNNNQNNDNNIIIV